VLIATGLLRGERMVALPGPKALLAWAFLVTLGSMLAYSAYAYLLANVRAAVATSYAYVNPIVAVALGALFAGERVAPSAIAALLLILGGVAVVLMRKMKDEKRETG